MAKTAVRLFFGVAAVAVLAASTPAICVAQQPSFLGIGFLSGHNTSRADAVSADGSVVVGLSGPQALGTSPPSQAFRWTSGSGMVGLGFLTDSSISWALGVSADGQTVVGLGGSPQQAFRWTPSNGMDALGGNSSIANGVSGDGSVVVGGEALAINGVGVQRGFYWTVPTGMVAFVALTGK